MPTLLPLCELHTIRHCREQPSEIGKSGDERPTPGHARYLPFHARGCARHQMIEQLQGING